jgi:hypothetical protein
MSDESINDAVEFAETASSTSDDSGNKRTALDRLFASDEYEEEREEKRGKVKPGRATQYQLYGPGYKPASATIKTLPSGQYDIEADQNGIFVTPVAPPTGLLLELPEMRSEEVISIVENFWNSEKDYKEGNDFVVGGACYKAGIMIFGPPGTGKSCTIKLVSRKLIERGGTVFFASCHPAAVQKLLQDFRTIEPERKCIVILEDLDTLIHNYGEYQYLEMLDSAKTIDNVLFIATTNYPDRLDARIYNRPGRFSSVIKIGLPGVKAREAYLKEILKKHDDVEFLVANTKNFSIDHLTALVNAVYREKKKMDVEIERLKALFKIPKAEEEKAIGFGNDD